MHILFLNQYTLLNTFTSLLKNSIFNTHLFNMRHIDVVVIKQKEIFWKHKKKYIRCPINNMCMLECCALRTSYYKRIDAEVNNISRNSTPFSVSDPFRSIILKYGILSWLMKEKRTFVNGNYIGSWAIQLNSFPRAFPKSPRTTNTVFNECTGIYI